MNKKIVFVLLVLIAICAVSSVSASDNLTDTVCDSADTQSIDSINDETILKEDSNENNNYRTIQQEIDSANDGDTITLTGNYTCDYLITVNKSVNIVGSGEGASIKWIGEGKEYTSPFFNVESSDVILNNIKFNGGNFLFGGAITWKGDNGTIKNCEFNDNLASSVEYGIGGAVLVLGNNCTIINSTFTNNQAYQYGGAVIVAAENCKIMECEFRDNSASGKKGYGGALMLNSTRGIVKNCIFINNHVTTYGGAISVQNINNTISDCVFINNYVTDIIENETDVDYTGGGAIFSICTGLVIDNCNFTGNNASGSIAGALSLGINNTVKNSYFKSNYAAGANDIMASKSSKITSNYIVLDYMESVIESVYGVNETQLRQSNTFEITKIDSRVVFSAGMVFEYTRSGTISVTAEGGKIELKNIRVLNHPEAKISFSNNVITVSGLEVGKYTLRVTTTPDDNHNAVDADLSVTVNKATAVIKASKMTVALKKGNLWTIKLVDAKTGNAISNMKLTLKVYTGKKYKTVTVTTDSNGIASYQTKSLAKGTHKIVVSGSHAGYQFNTLTSSIKVIKQKALKFKVKSKSLKFTSSLSITVTYKKKPINGIKLNLLVYTGKKYKTVTLKSKTKGKYKGVCGWATNKISVGTHKVIIQPASIKYGGSKKVKMKLKKSAKKYPSMESKI